MEGFIHCPMEGGMHCPMVLDSYSMGRPADCPSGGTAHCPIEGSRVGSVLYKSRLPIECIGIDILVRFWCKCVCWVPIMAHGLDCPFMLLCWACWACVDAITSDEEMKPPWLSPTARND